MSAWQVDVAAGPYGGGLSGVTWDGSGIIFSAPGQANLLRLEGSKVSVWRNYMPHIYGLAAGPEGIVYGAQSASRRIVEYRADGTTHVVADRLDGLIHNNPYALCLDRHGNIWFTDPILGIEAPGPDIHPYLPHASVLRVRRLGNRGVRLDRASYDTSFPTAIALSPDEKSLYVSENDPDTAGLRELRSYALRTDGALGAYRVLHTFGSDQRGAHAGVHGLCVSADGRVVACAGDSSSGPGPMLYVFDPSGRVLETHPLTDAPMGCCFGDAELRTLYVATSGGELLRISGTSLRGACHP